MVGDRGGERGYLEICGCEKEGESTFSVREQLKGTIKHHGNAVSGIEAVLTGDTSTPANQTTTQQHTRTSKTGGKDMLGDAGLAAATIGMALHDTPSTAHAAEHEGVIYHQVVSNNTSSNTSDSSYYRHNNNDDEQKVIVATRGANNGNYTTTGIQATRKLI